MAANYAKVGPELHEMADEGWCWRPGRRLGSGNRSLRLSTQRVTIQVAAGRFVAGTKVARMQNATALFMNVVE